MAIPFNQLIVRMQTALADGSCKSNDEWAAAFPGVHCWFRPDDDTARLESCTLCGVIRRADDRNKPCNGLVRITLRD